MRSLTAAKYVANISSAVLAAAFSLAAPASAQTAQLTVNVPFGFESGRDHFAPGVYKIALSASTPIIHIAGQTSSTFQMTQPQSTLDPCDVSKVIFARYGSQYVLKEVWVAGSTSHARTVKSKLEKELEVARTNITNPGYVALLTMPR